MIDLYSGVGIFSGTIGSGRQVTAIEQNISATKDSIHNLGNAVNHVCSRVEQWEVVPHDFVIANPSRSGMSKRVPNIIEKTGAWFSYDNVKIGQGRENSKNYLKENNDVLKSVVKKVEAFMGLGK